MVGSAGFKLQRQLRLGIDAVMGVMLADESVSSFESSSRFQLVCPDSFGPPSVDEKLTRWTKSLVTLKLGVVTYGVRTKPPRMYQVLMLNDDYTPMEFVVMVLQQYFQRDIETATLIMLKIHHEGREVCGVYPKDVAATKVELVVAAARRVGHPLQCTMEAA